MEGFQLDLKTVHVSATNAHGELARELERLIAEQGIEISSRSGAEYVIDIKSEQKFRRPVATSGDISVSEYELRLETVFEVASRDGTVLIQLARIVAEKIYSFDRNSLIGSSEEEKLLMGEMRRDVAGQLLRRFSASLRNLHSEPSGSDLKSTETKNS
jgi:outer membrane lipopolysaccharide assembly protein LptE/RlpB